MSGHHIPNETIRAMIELLSDWPDNGKPPHSDATLAAVALGYIENREITKPCRACGKPELDYRYMHVTLAGRLFLAAVQGKLFEQPESTP